MQAMCGEDGDRGGRLRFLTYLAPGLPMDLFRGVVQHLERTLGVQTELTSDPTRSAPEPGARDPFSAGEADVGFLCAPGYLWLSESDPPVVELVPAAFQFDDPRYQGRPAYLAELVVPGDSPARSLRDLRGCRWVYNDTCSLSGYFSVLEALARLGTGPGFFSSALPIGSHHAALAALAAGEADCAAIDSNVLRLMRRHDALLVGSVRVIESFGPYPVQPIVARSALPRASKRALALALLSMHEDERGGPALARHGVRRFARVQPQYYEPERPLLKACSLAR